MSRGKFAAAVAFLSAALFVWAAADWAASDDGEGWFSVVAPLAVASVIGAVACGIGAGVRRSRSSRRDEPRSSVLILGAISVGLLASCPVNMRWDDGCNDHGARVPASLVPYIKARNPQAVPYGGTMTSVLCFDSTDTAPFR